MTFSALGINLLILIGTFLIFDKGLSKKYISTFTLLVLSLLTAPLFHYQSPKLIFNIFPFLTLLILFLILRTKSKILVLNLGLLYILLISLFVNGIIAYPFHFQIDNTILIDQHISDAIFQHQHDALYLPFRLRPILFNGTVYLYFLLTHAFYFLSFSNLYNIFLIANFYPLITGLIKLIRQRSPEKFFILGSITIAYVVIGFSRSVQEIHSLFIISPLFIYLILLGLKELNIKLYLTLLALSLAIQVF
jgi:hypothetical protein